MTHAIVTTVDGPYSRYLDGWADAILALDRPPDQVVIVNNGTDRTAVKEAASRLGAEVVDTPWHVNRGRARNIAVAASRTEWVQHLDVDDEPEPWALSDTDALRDRADVVSWGWRRISDEGRPRGAQQRLYNTHQGKATLASKAPASAVSPFRRWLWEAQPYREDMDGSWDTALWIGFAHLDARFVPTGRPCYRYRYHRDSLFQARPAFHKKRLGLRLNQLRHDPPDDVCVVVPLRTDDPDRLRAAEWVRAWYAEHFPSWRWVEADCDGDWNKPRALNATVAELDCRTLVVTDADLTVPEDNLRQAVAIAAHVPWIVPHETIHRLDRHATEQIYEGGPADLSRCHMKPYLGVDGGGIFVIARAQWQRAGGMDETFGGWGCEDEAFAAAANTLLGRRVRLDGPLTHLWHEPGPRSRHPQFAANRARLRLYRAAEGNRETMRTITGEVEMGTEARYVNTRTGKTVTVEVGSSSHARFERLVAHGRVYVRAGQQAEADTVEPDTVPEEEVAADTDVEADEPDIYGDTIDHRGYGPPPKTGKGSSKQAWLDYATSVNVGAVPSMTKAEIISACEKFGYA